MNIVDDTEEEERWVPVKDFEECYEVSSYGRIKSISRHVEVKNRKRLRTMHVPEYMMYPAINADGYYRVGLSKNGVQTNIFLHIIVATAFIPRKDSAAKEVNHIDNNKFNNNYKNLEWVTHLENMQHASTSKVFPDRSGERNTKAYLTWEKVNEIRKLERENKRVDTGELAIRYNVARSTINRILNNSAWRV